MSQSSSSQFEIDSDDDFFEGHHGRDSQPSDHQKSVNHASDYDWSQEISTTQRNRERNEHYSNMLHQNDPSSRPSTPGISSGISAVSDYEDMNNIFTIQKNPQQRTPLMQNDQRKQVSKKKKKTDNNVMAPPPAKRVYRGHMNEEYQQNSSSRKRQDDSLLVDQGFITQRYITMTDYADMQMDRISKMPEAQLEQLLRQVDQIRQIWMPPQKDGLETMPEYILKAAELVTSSAMSITKEMLGEEGRVVEDDDLILTVPIVTNAYIKTVKQYHELVDEIVYRSPLEPKRKSELITMEAAVIRRMEGMFETIRHYMSSQTIDLMSIGQANLKLIQLHDPDLKNNPVMEVCNMFLSRLKSLNIRRGPSMGMFYIEQFTPEGKSTRYWKEFMTIEEWIKAEIDLNVGDNRHYFFKALGNHGQPFLLRHFLQCGETSIPTIEYQRCKYSFRNGIWDVNKNVFLPYDHPDFYKVFPGSTQTYGYYAYDFRADLFDLETGQFIQGSVDPRTLKCDMVDHILDTQNIPEEAQRFYWIHCARMQRVANCDGTEWSMFVEGIAHSGKSTLVHYNLEAVPISRRLVIPSHGETHFANDSFLGRDGKCVVDLIVCAEVDKNFSIPQGQVNSWISGEGVGAPSKNSTIKSTPRWTAAFLAVGNWYFHWDNTQGQVTRRFPKMVFTKVPKTHKNVTLEMIRADMPNYLLKSNLLYHEWINSINEARKHPEIYGAKAGSTNIYDHLPPYFEETKRKHLAERSPQIAFLTDQSWVTITEHHDDVVDMNTLRWGVTAYQVAAGMYAIHQAKICLEKLVVQALKTIIQQNEGIIIEKNERKNIVRGLCLTQEALEKIKELTDRNQRSIGSSYK